MIRFFLGFWIFATSAFACADDLRREAAWERLQSAHRAGTTLGIRVRRGSRYRTLRGRVVEIHGTEAAGATFDFVDAATGATVTYGFFDEAGALRVVVN